MNIKRSSYWCIQFLFLILINTSVFGQSPGGVSAPGSMVSGVNYSLYSGGDAVLSDGIQTAFMHTGYINDFFRPDAYVKDEIASNFSMRLTTTLSLANAGTYQFQFLNTDDNAYLILDGNAIITTPGLGTFTSAVQNLSAGNHSLEVRYSDVGGVTNLELQWRGTVGGLDVGTTFVNIANNKLFITPLMSAWYKANSGISGAEGSSPGTWLDNSSNANNLTLISGYNPMYYGTTAAQLINFNPSVDFTNDEYAGPNNSNGIAMGNQSKSVFAVITKPVYNAGTGFITTIGRDQVSNTSFGLYTTGSNALVTGFNTWQQANGYFAANQDNVPNVLGGVYSNTNILGSNNAFLYGNGLMVSNGTQNWATTLNDYEDVNVGKENWTGSTGHTGKIMEVIHYPWNLSATERLRVESYLALKYGITLGSTSNVVSYVSSQGSGIWTGNSTYQNNVAGIGRDDNSALQQKQSSSMNTYSPQVLIGNGTSLFGTNASNTNVFSSDLSFLMWGDNNLSSAINLAISSVPLVNYRMPRVWKIQETGTVGNVLVAWPANDISLQLLTSTDPTFASGVTATPLSSTVLVNGNVYSTTVFDFTAGQFFTFGKFKGAPGGVSANLRLWLKADVSFSPTVWTDQSLSDNDYTQTNVSAQPGLLAPATKFNFNPAVNFSAQFMVVPAGKPFTANNKDGSVFVMANHSTIAGYQEYLGFGGTTTGAAVTNANDPVVGQLNGAQYWYDGDLPIASGANNVVNISSLNDFRWTYSSSTALPLNIARNAIPCYTSNVLMNVINTNNGSVLGSQPEYLYAAMPEVIAYERNLTTAEMSKVRSYLAVKYGVTLGSSSNPVTYLNSSGATIWNGVSTYQNNIAGIGRDDAGTLNQKQSTSINPGLQVLIGNGTSLNGDNAANTNTFSVDQSFEIWGDNGASTNFSTTFTANSLYDYRMARVWKVQETGTVGNVVLGWPYPATNLALVTNASDPTFASGNNYYPLSGVPVLIGGVNYYTVGVDLTNNSYFTFVASVGAPGGVASNLMFWSKADVNMDAGAWPDYSINLNPVEITGSLNISAANANHNFQPYYKGFSASNYFLEDNCSFAGNAIYTPTSLSAFSAITPSSATSAGRITGTDNDLDYSAEPYLSLNASGKPRYFKYWGNTNWLDHTSSVTASQSSLVHFTTNQSTKLLQVGLNNLISSTSFLGDNFGNWGPYMTIGYGTYDLSGAFPGDIMEIIWYTKALSNAEQLRVNSYLAVKYGITLNQTPLTNYMASNGTTTVWNATTNSGYNNNIIGLAQDARTALFQKQARSAAGTDVFSMFLGPTKYSANAANTSTFSGGISSYFMVGTDAQAVLNTVYPHPDVPVGINSRLKRRWKTQLTNFTNTNLSFEFDLTGYATGPMYASDLRLLVDGDGVFATGASMYGASTTPSVSVTLVGQVVTISGIDAAWFASNPYFTLGSILGTTQLPVELTDFEATCNEAEQRIDLSWTTASEINNNYFTVEQSKDIIEWTEVGSIKGAGFSDLPHSYELSDYINGEGVFYYRLRQTDYNGIEKYFREIKSIEKCYTNSFISYPNPANTFINLEGEGVAKVEILTNVGRLVGKETTNTKAFNHTINLSTLVSGIYYLKVYFVDGSIKYEKVIKRHD